MKGDLFRGRLSRYCNPKLLLEHVLMVNGLAFND